MSASRTQGFMPTLRLVQNPVNCRQAPSSACSKPPICFVRGVNLNNWGGARTCCNNSFCVFFARDLLIESYINSEILQGFDATLIIATRYRCAHHPNCWDSPPSQKPPFENPQLDSQPPPFAQALSFVGVGRVLALASKPLIDHQ